MAIFAPQPQETNRRQLQNEITLWLQTLRECEEQGDELNADLVRESMNEALDRLSAMIPEAEKAKAVTRKRRLRRG